MRCLIATTALAFLLVGCGEPDPQYETELNIRVAGQDAVRSYLRSDNVNFDWEVHTHPAGDGYWVTKGVFRAGGVANRYGARFVLFGDSYELDNLIINGEQVYLRE